MNGWSADIRASVPRREDSLERDDEEDCQHRLKVQMGLSTTGVGYGSRSQRLCCRSCAVNAGSFDRGLRGKDVASGRGARGGISGAHQAVRVARNLAGIQGVNVLAARLAQHDVRTVDGRPALQVGQREGDPSVAAVRGAEQSEQGLVLVDRKELSVALREAFWRESESDQADLSEKWIRHSDL